MHDGEAEPLNAALANFLADYKRIGASFKLFRECERATDGILFNSGLSSNALGTLSPLN